MKSKDLKPGDKIVYQEGWTGATACKATFVALVPGVQRKYSSSKTATKARVTLHPGGRSYEQIVRLATLHAKTWEQLDAEHSASRANAEALLQDRQVLHDRWAKAAEAVQQLGLHAPHGWTLHPAPFTKNDHLTPIALIEGLLDLISAQDEEITRLHEVATS